MQSSTLQLIRLPATFQAMNILDLSANQSLERTRSAAASGFAGQHCCRAAQLQIRYTSG